jgi:hypothetical protein
MSISPERRNSTVATRAHTDRRARGVFINTAEANCSIYESGRMVYSCIQDSDAYTLEYFSLNTFDITYFSATGRIKPLEHTQPDAPDFLDGYDFWVFNWHPYTMAPHLTNESIASLPGLENGSPRRFRRLHRT